MNRRALIVGAIVWTALLGFGAQWALRPWLWSLTSENARASVVETQREFPMHLARLGNSNLRTYSERIEKEDTDPPADFDAQDWAQREARTRAVAFVVLWTAGGFLTHWLVGRIVRGKTALE
jgi:hypothetical protein